MALPTGFDPRTGRITGVTTPSFSSSHNTTIDFSSYTSLRSSEVRRQSWWTRLDNCIRLIGNWFDDKIEPVSSWFALIAALIGLIWLLVWVFSDNNILYIVLRFIGACFIGYIALIGIGICMWLIELSMKIVRFIFWNIYTLLLTILIGGGILIYSNNAGSSRSNKITTTNTEYVTPKATSTKYRCTNSSLNVRAQPTTSSAVKGVIHRNDIVEVYGIYDGFGKIIYKGQTAYVGMKYLTPVN